jgi:hypothetical protein
MTGIKYKLNNKLKHRKNERLKKKRFPMVFTV